MGDPRSNTTGRSAATVKASKSDSGENARPGSDDLLVTHETIAKRAYELYERGQYQDGHALTHWLEAEREIVSRSRGLRA